jgi:hypothetical protein
MTLRAEERTVRLGISMGRELRNRALLPLLLLIAISGSACNHTKRITPMHAYNTGDVRLALQLQQERVLEDDTDRALENLRLAAMALSVADWELGERALRSATSEMTNFQADGEYAAWVMSESDKEWKGEPYEKMAAFLELGMLFWRRGEEGNALASFKQALLADTGTTQERFLSDFIAGWVLQAMIYEEVGEPHNARPTIDKGIDSVWSRSTVNVLTDVLWETPLEGLDEGLADEARGVLASSIGAGVSAHPRDPKEAVRAAVDHASNNLLAQQQMKKTERMGLFEPWSKKDFERVGAAMPAVADAWREQTFALPDSVTMQGEAFARSMASLMADPPNTVVLVEWGPGPVKTRTGEYGHMLTIVPRDEVPPPGPVDLLVDGVAPDIAWMDSLSYQATTRGGRRVDSYLRGKAVYKDVSLGLGYAFLIMGDSVLHSAGGDSGAGVLGAILVGIGIAAATSGAAANPAADIRAWDFVPEEYYLLTANLPPGEHTLEVQGVTFPITVPEHGRAVELITRDARRFGPEAGGWYMPVVETTE